MKLFFLDKDLTDLADQSSSIMFAIRDVLLTYDNIEEVSTPEEGDAIIIQEEKSTFKNFRYIDRLLQDPYVGAHLNKIFTINTDDSATGLLRGLYTSMPKNRYDPRLQRVVPYIEYPNPLVFEDKTDVTTEYLGVWCGNTRSNKIRNLLVQTLQDRSGFFIKSTDSWFNHEEQELKCYVEAIRRAKFSLCPAGWAPATMRIYESMALGRCPVIIADNFVPPTGPDWSEFALFFPEKSIASLPAFLQLQEHRYAALGTKAKENWEKYFGGDRLRTYYAEALLSLIRSTQPFSRFEEIRRWRSFSTYWNNQWSFPQRMVNRLKKTVAR